MASFPFVVDSVNSGLVPLAVGVKSAGLFALQNSNVRYMVGGDGTNTIIYKSVDQGQHWGQVGAGSIPQGAYCLFGSKIRLVSVPLSNDGFVIYDFDTSNDTWSGIIATVVIPAFNIGGHEFSCVQLGNTTFVAGSWIHLSPFQNSSAFITYNGGWSAPTAFSQGTGGARGQSVSSLVATTTRVHVFLGCFENVGGDGAIYQSELTSGSGGITRMSGTDFNSSGLQPPPTLTNPCASNDVVCYPAQVSNTMFFFTSPDGGVLSFTDVSHIDMDPTVDPMFQLTGFTLCAFDTGFRFFFAIINSVSNIMYYFDVGTLSFVFVGAAMGSSFQNLVSCQTDIGYAIGWIE